MEVDGLSGSYCTRAYTLCAMAETWWEYIQRITEGASQADIARALDLDATTVWRWRADKAKPGPEGAIEVARAYGRPVAEALAALGVITPEEARVTEVVVKGAPSDLDDDELIEELRRRLGRSTS